MLTKFETKSNRVKGLAFHHSRPWILASLHSGVIQVTNFASRMCLIKYLSGKDGVTRKLWDYRMGTLIDRFSEHDGPVRGIQFHHTQPIFVSGGDDYKVKVWSYKTRRCLFTLSGHLDYIRTVQFHPQHPWVVSASDDQTVRIWNWQSRSCMTVLTGHNHYVMCAMFHPREDLVVSASLDQTVRVWDIGGLRKKSATPGGDDSNMNSDLFGNGDVVVKYVLEGHERGVNWASFHPVLPLIVSGADDRCIKLWRMNESKAWEVDTLRGHMNNVSCVMFAGKEDLIISNSEDRTIKVWDTSRRVTLHTYRRENDRFWILAAHPEVNLLAAGHDCGMIVFKLQRERVPFAVHGTNVYFVANRQICHYDVATRETRTLQSMRKAPGAAFKTGIIRRMSYNAAEHAVLLSLDDDHGKFQMFHLPSGSTTSTRGEVAETFGAPGTCAVFVARNRFAVWDKVGMQIQIRNLSNEITKRVPPPDTTCSAIHPAGTGMLLCRCEERVVLVDVQQRQSVAEVQATHVKYVVWDAAMQNVAMLSKHAIVLADAKLRNVCTVHETIRVKSAAWSDSGVLLFTTLNHIKYCLPNGDSGVVRTLDKPVYLVAVVGDTLHALDREGAAVQIQIDPSEYRFKQALEKRNYDEVLKLIRSGKLCGQAIIAFLRKKGFPEVALHFVQDDRLRFELAVECGNLEVALETAQRLDDKDLIARLGTEAFRHGNLDIVEWCYQQIKAYDRLSFLYAITGNTDKLAKMSKIAEMRDDIMSRYQNSLLVGGARARVKILTDAGHYALAYVAAKAHGLDAEAASLAESITAEGGELPDVSPSASLMMPPTPILRHGNWPLLEVTASMFEGKLMADKSNGAAGAAALDIGDVELDGAWGGDELDLRGADGAADAIAGLDLGGEDGEEDEGWDMEDLELPADLPAAPAGAAPSGPFVAPPPGQTVAQRWAARAKLPAEHVAAGAFDTAMRMLKLQLGITEFEPLKANMLATHAAAFAHVAGLPGLDSVAFGVDSTWSKDEPTAPPALPTTPFALPALEAQLKAAYRLVTEGKFADALAAFNAMLLAIPLVVVATRKEVDDVKELVTICREYHTGLRCEIARKSCTEPARAAELAAYFTHCKMQPVHRALALRSAMTLFYKSKMFATCATFCRRLLELSPPEKIAAQARSVLQVCEKSPQDALRINYDPRNPSFLCASTFVPIYQGSRFVECPYTGAKFVPECEGQVSPLGNVARIGADASGLVCSHTQIR